jgi:hypothetical protein
MKAVARRLTNKDDVAYVAGFTSRPMLHIQKAGPPSASAKPFNLFSFINTITKFGNNLTIEELRGPSTGSSNKSSLFSMSMIPTESQ